MRAFKSVGASLVLGLLLLGAPAYAGPIEDRAAEASKILGRFDDDLLSKKKQEQLLAIFESLTPLQRFRVFNELDKAQGSQLRTVHDRLSEANRARLLALCDESGKAASAAGLQTIGVISDVDDTAVPTEYQPDGPRSYDGARHFYDTLTHEPIHYVTARPKLFVPETVVHLQESGMPAGTFSTRSGFWGILFGGDKHIEESKVANIEMWMKLHPGKRFVLLGDTAQADAEVYRRISASHPDQVAAVFVHQAGGKVRDPKDYPGATLFNTYPEAEAIWNAHRNDPKPLPGLTPATNHTVEQTAGFFSSVKSFFHDAKVVAKSNLISALKKVGIGD